MSSGDSNPGKPAAANSPATRTPARYRLASPRDRASCTKERSDGPAVESDATPVTSRSGSPRTRAPRNSATCLARIRGWLRLSRSLSKEHPYTHTDDAGGSETLEASHLAQHVGDPVVAHSVQQEISEIEKVGAARHQELRPVEQILDGHSQLAAQAIVPHDRLVQRQVRHPRAWSVKRPFPGVADGPRCRK